jgi:predicted dienelactone hydrolase
MRGLATVTSSATYVDRTRPTVSRGRTIAATRTLTATIVRPTAAGSYPLVVFAHGYQLGPGSYQHLIGVLASAGYVVAAPSFPLADASVAGGNLDRGDIPNQSADLSFVIDQVLSGPLAASVDASHMGAVGHSDGADTVLDLGYHPQRRDPRVSAIAALSPDAMTSATTGGPPLLIVHGNRDGIVPFDNATTVFGQVPAHRFLVTLLGGDHLPPVQGVAPWAAVVERTVVDLLDLRVAGRTTGEDDLIADASVPGVASIEGAG